MDTLKTILNLIEKNYETDAHFEREAGLKPKTVDSWKRGNSSAYLKMLPKLSETFNVSTDYLLGNTNNPTPPNAEPTDEVSEYLDILHKRDDMRMLFSVAKNATKEDIKIAADIIENLIKKQRGEN